VVLKLLVASVATALTVAGVVLLLSFAALTFESPTGIEELLKMIVALMAAYFFVRVGRGVWRDLRGHHPEVEPGGTEVGSNPSAREEEGSGWDSER
jgi:hypothetical protein